MYTFKKIVSQFLFPLPLSISICLIGVLILLFTAKKTLGKFFIITGAALLLLFSFNPFANYILGDLEQQYATYHPDSQSNAIPFIVVLGGGHFPDSSLPTTSQVGSSSLKRLIEGILLHQSIPQSKLILSGGGAYEKSEAETYRDIAVQLGVLRENIILEKNSFDTKDQARLLAKIIGQEQFILVTSASHMPRSMALLQKNGLNPIAAPTDHKVLNTDSYVPWLPNSGALSKTKNAFYEYMGQVWSKLRDQM